jgi:hypothetical protein
MRHPRFNIMARLRRFLSALSLVALIGCANAGDDRGEQTAIDAARRAVAERDSWPHGAEFTAKPIKDGWTVTAWRIEYPNNKGASRFVPGGFRSITIDRAGKVTQYFRGH